jgi:hypothetical protein
MFLPVICLHLAGCSPKSDINSALDFVDRFHRDLGAQDYGGLAALIDPEFRADVTKERLEKIRSRLGDMRAAKMTNYTVIYEMRAAKVRLDYDTQFANARAKEVFEVKQQDGKNTISGYRIDSPLLDGK